MITATLIAIAIVFGIVVPIVALLSYRAFGAKECAFERECAAFWRDNA